MRSWKWWIAVAVLAACSARPTALDGPQVPDDAQSDGAAVDDMQDDLGAVDDNVADPDVVADDAQVEDAPTSDVLVPTPIGPRGGTVDRMRFAVFGDIRPALPIPGSPYPAMIFGDVMTAVQASSVQFAVATGDYMNAAFCPTCVNAQLDLLLGAERNFMGHVFHSMGNHECNTVTTVNCPNENESDNIRIARMRLLPMEAHPYFEWTIVTSRGNAHFIATSPNTWNPTQQAWLAIQLAVPAMYTFVIAHEPPADPGPGTAAIEDMIRTRAGGVSMRFYGHTHNYQHVLPNATITGNAGAPLSGGGYYGFVVVEQRADGNLVVTAYEVGRPPMVRDTFVVQPNGMPGR